MDADTARSRRARLKLILTLLSLALSALAIWWANNNLSSYYLNTQPCRHQRHTGREHEPDLRLHGTVLAGTRRLHGSRGIHLRAADVAHALKADHLPAPLAWPFNAVTLPPFPAVLLAGLAAAVMAYSSVCPCCLRGDYLASPPGVRRDHPSGGKQHTHYHQRGTGPERHTFIRQ